MKFEPLLTSLTLSRSAIQRRNRETFTDLQWRQVLASPNIKAIELRDFRVELNGAELKFHNLQNFDANSLKIDLGSDLDGNSYAAVLVEKPVDDSWRDLRSLGAKLNDRDVALMATAVALANWHARATFCPVCGGATTVTNAGWSRTCAKCKQVQHPRSDPAVIALIVDKDDRALIGRRAEWAESSFSTFAGFVEAGESAEMALIRELKEESGISVQLSDISYRGSQVWPFPASLMLGYQVKIQSQESVPDGMEIVEVRWYTRDEMKFDCEEGRLQLPPSISIARQLIEEWFGSALPGEWLRP
jgi:NAD+ diphosphatase